MNNTLGWFIFFQSENLVTQSSSGVREHIWGMWRSKGAWGVSSFISSITDILLPSSQFSNLLDMVEAPDQLYENSEVYR